MIPDFLAEARKRGVYTSWLDHRENQELFLASGVRQLLQAQHKHYPGSLITMCGTQDMIPFRAANWHLLMKDCGGIYSYLRAHALQQRSFIPENKRIFWLQWSGYYYPVEVLSRRLAFQMALGGSGAGLPRRRFRPGRSGSRPGKAPLHLPDKVEICFYDLFTRKKIGEGTSFQAKLSYPGGHLLFSMIPGEPEPVRAEITRSDRLIRGHFTASPHPVRLRCFRNGTELPAYRKIFYPGERTFTVSLADNELDGNYSIILDDLLSSSSGTFPVPGV